MTEADGELWLVRLGDLPPSLHLTHQGNLDALGVDDRVSTGRLGRNRDEDLLLDTCGRLIDGVYDWWDGGTPPIVYRARTIPMGRSAAFTDAADVEIVDVGPLRKATALTVHLVLRAGFTVPNAWLT